MYRLQDGRLVPCEPEPPDRLRQGLAQVFHRNGAIYACRREVVEQGTLIGSDARPYVMPRERSVNIDDELDLTLAELLVHR
jgi:CMP-N,N'-diacetyllegionaminic acid synthase